MYRPKGKLLADYLLDILACLDEVSTRLLVVEVTGIALIDCLAQNIVDDDVAIAGSDLLQSIALSDFDELLEAVQTVWIIPLGIQIGCGTSSGNGEGSYRIIK